MSETLSLTAYEFIVGPLLDNPHRAGKRLRPPLDDRHSARRGTYRVIYRINKDQRRVTVVGVIHRSDCLSVIGAAPSNRALALQTPARLSDKRHYVILNGSPSSQPCLTHARSLSVGAASLETSLQMLGLGANLARNLIWSEVSREFLASESVRRRSRMPVVAMWPAAPWSTPE